MSNSQNHPLEKKLNAIREDLAEFHLDWKKFSESKQVHKNHDFLKKFSEDILRLHQDVKEISSEKKYEDETSLILYLLTTSWGAPFVEQFSLIQAAESYNPKKDIEELEVYHLLRDFKNYSRTFNTELYSVLEDFREELES